MCISNPIAVNALSLAIQYHQMMPVSPVDLIITADVFYGWLKEKSKEEK